MTDGQTVIEKLYPSLAGTNKILRETTMATYPVHPGSWCIHASIHPFDPNRTHNMITLANLH
jgi:hypothetical protein